MSVNTRSKASTPVPDSDTPVLTRGMLGHLGEAEKERYAIALKEDGNALYKQQNFIEAIKFYTAALVMKEDAVFYSNRSACYSGLKDYQKVIEDTSAALAIKPDFQKCLARRAAAYEKMGQHEQAMFDWLAATACDTDEPSAVLTTQFKKTTEKALLKYVEKMEADRGQQMPSADYCSAYLGGFDYETSVEGILGDMSTVAKHSADYFLAAALESLYTKDSHRYRDADGLIESALVLYERELTANPNHQLLKLKLALAYEYSGVMKHLKSDTSAIIDIKRAMEMNPERSRAFVFHGYMLSEVSLFKDSEEAFKKALALAPNSAEVHFHRGVLYERKYNHDGDQKDLKKARDAYTKAKDLNGRNVHTLIKLLNVLVLDNDMAELQKLSGTMRSQFARSPELANYEGEVSRDSGDWAGALAKFQLSALLGDISPGASMRCVPIANAAMMLINNFKPTEWELEAAADMLNRGLKIDHESDVVMLALGQVEMLKGNTEEGIEIYKEAANLCPNYETRIITAGLAFNQSVKSKLQNHPVLKGKLEKLNIDEMFPSFAASPAGLIDILGGFSCDCCRGKSGSYALHS